MPHNRVKEEGFRESTESWKALLLSLRDRYVNLEITYGGRQHPSEIILRVRGASEG